MENKELELIYCFTKDMREHTKKNSEGYKWYTIDGVPIWEARNEDIQSKVKQFLSKLTIDSMCKYLGTEVYRFADIEDFDIDHQLKWAIESGHDAEEIETLLKVQRVYKRAGFVIHITQADFLWSTYSDELCAQWLGIEDDDSTWLSILVYVILNDEIYGQLTNVD